MAVPKVVYRGPPGKHSWARWMVARTIRKNQNNLISVIGKTGSGKTYSALSICEIMSKMDHVPFTIEHVVFSLRELMDLINSKTLRRGSKIVFDEPQASISARDFQSEANKVFNLLITTFRHRNLTLFFCTPFESLLDKNTRKLFHGRFETMSINVNKKTCRLKPRFLEYSDWKSEPYRKMLIVIYKKDMHARGYNTQKLFYWDVPKPSDELIELYEKKKLEFTDNLNKNISLRLVKFDETGKSATAVQGPEAFEKRKPLTEKQKQVMKTLANLNVSNKQLTAAKMLGMEGSVISFHKKAAMKKGYNLEEFKEDV